jgi:hypothetical protein
LTPKKILARLEISIGIDGAPRRLLEAIEQELLYKFALSAIEAAEAAEKHLQSISRLITSNGEQSAAQGLIYPLTILGNFSDVVAGSCCLFQDDSPLLGQLKSQRTQADALLLQMQQLSPDQFEKFGAKVLAELGVQFAKVTPHSNDQGIDFYGELSLGQAQERPAEFYKLAHDVRFAFVGQAKHYPKSSLGPDIVRELVGALSLARTKTFSKAHLDLLESVAIKPFSPLLAMLFTTGGLTSGAIQLANEAGIIARTGQQLAVFLADKGVGMEQTSTGHLFRQDLFQAWLNN